MPGCTAEAHKCHVPLGSVRARCMHMARVMRSSLQGVMRAASTSKASGKRVMPWLEGAVRPHLALGRTTVVLCMRGQLMWLAGPGHTAACHVPRQGCTPHLWPRRASRA